MPEFYALGVLWLITLGFSAFTNALLIRLIGLQMKSHREHVERLERQVQARDLAEAAAVEAAYSPASPSSGIERPDREPDAIAQMFADPPRRKREPA